MTAKETHESTDVARTIDEGTKRIFDATETLRQAAWQSFDRRRAFEWKLSFGLWTPLALSIAGLAAGEVTLGEDAAPERWFVSVIAFAVFVLHGWWSVYLAHVNAADLRKSYVYVAELFDGEPELGFEAEVAGGGGVVGFVHYAGTIKLDCCGSM